MQTFTAPLNTTYKIECWGASGGGGQDQNEGSHRGLGGYSEGRVMLTKDNTLFVFIGGAGGAHNRNGGYNGGGDAYHHGEKAPEYAGGGMTHLSTTDNPVPESILEDWNPSGTLIIAGGGGGSDDFDKYNLRNGENDGSGGHGGGFSGGEPKDRGIFVNGYAGTQNSGYMQGHGQNGSTNTGPSDWENAGGGGGWWGGRSTTSATGGAGGGSGYIGGVSNGSTLAGNQTFPSPTGGTETGHGGDGYCIITWFPLSLEP